MIYVCPAFPGMSDQLAAFSRLYAFPRVPAPPPEDGFVILDSGAYGLAKAGLKMSAAHIATLAAHYQQYGGENVLGIAPDEYLNPAVTQRRFSEWHQRHALPVVPVIQFRREGQLDLTSAYRQAQCYHQHLEGLPRVQGRVFLALSNPNMRASQCGSLKFLCARIRALFGECWLHNLGAGWSPQDIAAWRDLVCFDSIDSIAYYTDAQRGQRWHVGGSLTADPDTAPDILAAHNAQVARHIAANPKNT